MIDEGYIKYNVNWEKAGPLEEKSLIEINKYRDLAFGKGWIGEYPESGIGFGNISVRFPDNPDWFIISGTQTGGIEKLESDHYSLVTACNIAENALHCRGPIKASSEALTHASIYTLSSDVSAVIHIHNNEMWKTLINRAPTTPESIGYGTVEIANAVKKLFVKGQLKENDLLVMGGHEDGIISFGSNLEIAYLQILSFFEPEKGLKIVT